MSKAAISSELPWRLGLRELAYSSLIGDPLVSPDGQWVAYLGPGSQGPQLRLMSSDGTFEGPLSSRSLPSQFFGFGGAYVWAPDSSAVFQLGADGGVSRTDIRTGACELLREGRNPSEIAVSHGGSKLAVVWDTHRLEVIDLASGKSVSAPSSEFRLALNDEAVLGTLRNFDFLLHPRFGRTEDQLFLVGWNFPNMAWNSTALFEVFLAEPTSRVLSGRVWHESRDHYVSQPCPTAEGSVLVLSDASGFSQIHRLSEPRGSLQLVTTQTLGTDVGEIELSPGQRSYCDAGESIVAVTNHDGFGELITISNGDGSLQRMKRGVFGSLSCAKDKIFGLRSGARTPNSLFTLDLKTLTFGVLRVGQLPGVPPTEAVEPEVIRYLSSSETVEALDRGLGESAVAPMELVGRLYRTPQPLRGTIVAIHGGPTGQNRVTFSARTSYLLSAGYNVFQPDYRGSSGHGRAYRNALNGLYGVGDIVDCASGALHLRSLGIGADMPIVPMGSSSAGLTALGLLHWFPDLVAGAIAPFPVTDLAELSRTTHRLESRYFDKLVGDPGLYPDRYFQRSPINWTWTGGKALIFQGDADVVVPADLTRAFVEKTRGSLDVRYVEYPDAGHGWSAHWVVSEELREIVEFLEGLR